MALLRGRIWDRQRGVPLEARVQVMASTGELPRPQDALHKVGSGEPFFYAATAASRSRCPAGRRELVIERGTEYTPLPLEPQRSVRPARSTSTLRSSAGSSCPSRAGTAATRTSTTTRTRRGHWTDCASIRASRICQSWW